MRIPFLLCLTLLVAVGCTAESNGLSEAEGAALARCDRDNSCLDAGPTERPVAERPAECPRGTVPGIVLCAPGFDNVVVSRDPYCATCEPDHGLAERCRAAGLTPERCRAILGGGDDPNPIAERCRAAGISPERCRALVSDDDGGWSPAQRCRAAGLTPERCRAIITGEDESDLAERCRSAGLTIERCRALAYGDDDSRDGDARDGETRDPSRDEPTREESAREEPSRDEPSREEPSREEPQR